MSPNFWRTEIPLEVQCARTEIIVYWQLMHKVAICLPKIKTNKYITKGETTEILKSNLI